ncbi:MAG: patatin-like phospholipase family protein [Anaerolineaceae bacterium]|jgi:NTE family protein|nr:patatin-like phospholipase family protein [Anaerolineaceae bacterium]
MNENVKTRPSIGLALSGGGARGLAHIGVLRVLEREGISIDYLAGTSMGGVIAAGYAAGMSSRDLEREALGITHKRSILRLVDPGLPNGGLIRGRRMMAFFQYEFGELTFSELRLPLALVAVDLRSHQEVVLREGPVALALRATTSLPGVFMPVETNGRCLVDGGVLNNLPVDVAAGMGAEEVIAVDIGLAHSAGIGQWIGDRRWIPEGVANTLEVIDDTLYTLRHTAQEEKLRRFPPDVLLCPTLPSNVNSMVGYSRVDELIAAGEQAAEEHLEAIQSLLDGPRRWPLPTAYATARA